MSRTPGPSPWITSAPSHARSGVQVGPDCTWVKSRMRTPSSALLICFLSFVHGLGFGARGVFARIDPDVDDGRLAVAPHRLARALERRGDLAGVPHFLAIAAEHLGEFAEWD